MVLATESKPRMDDGRKVQNEYRVDMAECGTLVQDGSIGVSSLCENEWFELTNHFRLGGLSTPCEKTSDVWYSSCITVNVLPRLQKVAMLKRPSEHSRTKLMAEKKGWKRCHFRSEFEVMIQVSQKHCCKGIGSSPGIYGVNLIFLPFPLV